MPDSADKLTPGDALLAQVRDCYARIAYSHKTHEKCADTLERRGAGLKHVQIFLSVAVSGTLLADSVHDGSIPKVIPVLAAAALTIVNLYFKNYNFGQAAQQHKATADRLWVIRESYLSLLTDLVCGALLLPAAQVQRDKLQERAAAAHASAPRTNSSAYRQAQKALKVNEDLSFTDDEIDNLLPPALKKK